MLSLKSSLLTNPESPTFKKARCFRYVYQSSRICTYVDFLLYRLRSLRWSYHGSRSAYEVLALHHILLVRAQAVRHAVRQAQRVLHNLPGRQA